MIPMLGLNPLTRALAIFGGPVCGAHFRRICEGGCLVVAHHGRLVIPLVRRMEEDSRPGRTELDGGNCGGS